MIKFSRLTLFALTAVYSSIVVSASLKNTIEWGTLTERLPYPVSDMTATLIPGRTNTDDDIILIAGGTNPFDHSYIQILMMQYPYKLCMH